MRVADVGARAVRRDDEDARHVRRREAGDDGRRLHREHLRVRLLADQHVQFVGRDGARRVAARVADEVVERAERHARPHVEDLLLAHQQVADGEDAPLVRSPTPDLIHARQARQAHAACTRAYAK